MTIRADNHPLSMRGFMTESESSTTLDALLSGGAGEPDAPSNPVTDDTQTIPARTGVLSAASEASAATEAVRGSRRRTQWTPPLPGDIGNTSTSSPNGPKSPSGPRRMQAKTWWVIGGAAAVVIVATAVVAATTLTGGSTRLDAATSSVPASAPGAGKLVPITSASPATSASPVQKAKPASTHFASPAAPVIKASPASSPIQPAAATTKAPTASAAAPATVTLPEPVSWWALNDDDTAETAADTMGAHTATGSNIDWCDAAAYGNCAIFDGTNSDFTTSGPVLDTAPGSSFTVSAAVNLGSTSGFQTILSQDGTYDSGFFLQYIGASDQWAFARVTGDTDSGPAGIRALSTTTVPALNTWTRLVGVFNASDDQLSLYVNGVLQGTATDSSPFAASGDLAIGRGQFDGAPTDWFKGDADQIEVWNVALTSAQVAKI